MDLSIVIVNYNTSEKLRDCLKSIAKSLTEYRFEVFIVDNASTDGSQEMIRSFIRSGLNNPEIYKFLPLEKNLGFTGGNNHAIGKSQADFVLLLNPDTEIAPDTLKVMLDYMKSHPEVGISGCKIVKPDGSLDLASRRSFPNPINAFFRLTRLSFLFPKSKLFANYNLTYLPEEEIAEVDAVVGAFMLISRPVLQKIGVLDEEFFMYGEDLDFCWRAKKSGFKIVYYPKTTIIHHKGSASRKASTRSLYEFHRAMIIFFRKHYRSDYFILTRLLVYLGIWTRFAILYIINLFRKEKIVSN